jgi:hypothetical protein
LVEITFDTQPGRDLPQWWSVNALIVNRQPWGR